MDSNFWHDRWQEDRIGFHKDEVHEDLDRYASLFLQGAQRILVPLCGKTRDLVHLAGMGHEVVGVELVDKAARAVFDEAGIEPQVREHAGFRVYEAERMTVYCGDFFELETEIVGSFERVWDRAALVALDRPRRDRYTAHLQRLMAPGARLLLNVVEYDQAVMQGPPWPIYEAEVREHYGAHEIQVLRQLDVIRDVRWRERGHKWWKSCAYLVQLP